MLGELEKVSQHKDVPGRRRWFADEEMDLIVWYSPAGEVTGFQLCYDKTGDEHAFTWRKGGSVVHTSVDQGEGLPTDNRTPIMAPDGTVPLARVVRDFRERSKELEPGLAALVLDSLAGR